MGHGENAGAHRRDDCDSVEDRAVTAAYRDKHCRWARVTFPIWLYVSVTGVVVYVMLYHLWPPIPQ